MAKLDDKLHDKIAAGLADQRIQPAVLAYKMLQESQYVNESMLQYIINYINIMATSKLVPMQLVEVQKECQVLRNSLEELGLVGVQGRTHVTNEYLAMQGVQAICQVRQDPQVALGSLGVFLCFKIHFINVMYLTYADCGTLINQTLRRGGNFAGTLYITNPIQYTYKGYSK